MLLLFYFYMVGKFSLSLSFISAPLLLICVSGRLYQDSLELCRRNSCAFNELIRLSSNRPGSFLEFIEVFKLLKTSTSPSFNLICPSQLGYGFSSDPPVDKYFGMYEQASLFRSLMVGLGFGEKGYAVQGGDIGSVIARIMACKYPEEVKAVNINYMPIAFPKEGNEGTLNLTERELINVEKAKVFAATGRGKVLFSSSFLPRAKYDVEH